MKDTITIADDGGREKEPAKTYSEDEMLVVSKEFLALVNAFCDRYQAAVIGSLLMSKDKDTNAMLFVMQGAFPERAEVDRALAYILTETRAFYDQHEKAL